LIKLLLTTRSVNPDCKSGLLTQSNTQFHEHANAPERFRRFDGEIRRVLVHVFPYAVLYTIGEGVIHIIAVMHCSANLATGSSEPNRPAKMHMSDTRSEATEDEIAVCAYFIWEQRRTQETEIYAR